MICPHCSSMLTKKEGKKRNKEHVKQQFSCKSCGKWFSIPIPSDVKEYDKKHIEPGKIFQVSSNEKLRIHGLTDVHVGANEFDLKKFQQAIKVIYEDPNARWFGNGDLIELIPPNYKINQRGQDMAPEDQYTAFLKLVQPIADKCLFIRGGNHDYLRSFNILDFDVCKTLAAEMDVPYFRLPGYAKISIQDKDWFLVSAHGKSGAKNGDNELNQMASVYSDGDVFFLGHNHQLYCKPMDSLTIDEKGDETLKRKWYVRGGSFMRYADYARYSFYGIQRTGWITMEFNKEQINCWEN